MFDPMAAIRVTSELDLNNRMFGLTKDLMDMQMFGQLIGFCTQLNLEPNESNLAKVKDLYISFTKGEREAKPAAAVK